MPNMCCNELRVMGPMRMLREFRRRVRGRYPRYAGDTGRQPVEAMCFHQLAPVPRDILRKRYGLLKAVASGRCGYSWQNEHWGCKWGAIESEVTIDECASGPLLVYTFHTPRVPPVEFLVTASKLFPFLVFEHHYSDCELQFAGVIFLWRGKIRGRGRMAYPY